MPDVPRLTPFASLAPRAVEAAVVALVGIPAAELTRRHVGTVPDEPDLWLASLEWTVNGRQVMIDAFPAESKRNAWFRTAHAAWAYAAPDDPFADPAWARRLNDFKSRTLAADRPDTAAGRTLAAVSAAFKPFARLKDEQFRAVLGPAENRSAILWLGTRCDQDCGQCWQSRTAPEPPPAIFAKWLDELISQGIRAITFSGGEPTLRPDLPDLVRRAKAGGASVVVESNGMNVANESLRASLRAAGVDCYALSLHASHAALSDTLTRTPGGFARTLKGLEGVRDEGTPIALHVLVDRRNVSDLITHAHFIRQLNDARKPGTPGIQRVSYSTPVRAFDAALHQRELPNLDELRPALTEAIAVLRAGGLEVEWCSQAGFAACAVNDPNESRRGLPTTPFADRQDRTLAPACSTCDVAPRCPGVHRFFLDLHGATSLRPLHPGTP